MRPTTNLIYNVSGQTLEYRHQSRPTSATVKVFYDVGTDDDTPLWTATATVDSVNATLTATSGLGQSDTTKINVSPTGIVTTRKYLLSENSLKEWISPNQIGGTAIYARQPLQNTYTTAATLVSTTLTVAVSSSFITNLNYVSDQLDPNPSYRVRWEIVDSSGTSVVYTYFDVVRAVVGYDVDISDLDMRAPGVFDGIPTQYQAEQGRPLLDAAWQSVQAKLASIGIDADALRDDSITDELVILRALNMIAIGGWRPTSYPSLTDYIQQTQTDYDRFIEQHFQVTLKHRIAQGTSGAAEPVKLKEYWAK